MTGAQRGLIQKFLKMVIPKNGDSSSTYLKKEQTQRTMWQLRFKEGGNEVL